MRLLPSAVALHDVRDVEGLCRGVLDRVLRQWGAHLRADHREDATSYLLAICWQLAGIDERGQPRVAWIVELGGKRLAVWHTSARAELELQKLNGGDWVVRAACPPPGSYQQGHGLSFSTFATGILERRVVDWYRRTFGDSRYGTRVQPLSLDALSATTGQSIADLVGPAPDSDEEEVLTRVSVAG